MCKSPNQLVFEITALAAAIAEGKTSDELAFLGAVLTQLADTLITISEQKEFCSGKCEDWFLNAYID